MRIRDAIGELQDQLAKLLVDIDRRDATPDYTNHKLIQETVEWRIRLIQELLKEAKLT